MFAEELACNGGPIGSFVDRYIGPLPLDFLATEFRFSKRVFQKIADELFAVGLWERDENGVISIRNFAEETTPTDPRAAERVRKYRERGMGELKADTSERDVEDRLFAAIMDGLLTINDAMPENPKRQRRIGNLYADIVLNIGPRLFVFEIKKRRANGLDLGQLQNYLTELRSRESADVHGVLIAPTFKDGIQAHADSSISFLTVAGDASEISLRSFHGLLGVKAEDQTLGQRSGNVRLTFGQCSGEKGEGRERDTDSADAESREEAGASPPLTKARAQARVRPAIEPGPTFDAELEREVVALFGLIAAGNKTGTIAESRIANERREIARRVESLGRDAMLHGLREAVRRGKDDVMYAVAVAKGYKATPLLAANGTATSGRFGSTPGNIAPEDRDGGWRNR